MIKIIERMKERKKKKKEKIPIEKVGTEYFQKKKTSRTKKSLL